METLTAWSAWFGALHAWVFENAVQPVLFELGFAAHTEPAFDATELFLIGAIEISLLALILGALEKWRPAEAWVDRKETRVDLLYTLMHRLGFIPLLFFAVLTPAVDTFDGWLRMQDFIPPKLEDALPWLNSHPLASFLTYVVLLDFVAYWLHRWQHSFQWWWALHALHHSQRQMSFWADDRNHVLDDLIVDALFALIALAVGVPPAQFITIVVATRVVESLSHANLRIGFGWLGERLLVSPRFHRVHHAIGLGHEGAVRGCNFAVLFPIWDTLFGTANWQKTFPPTGIRDQLEGRDYGVGFWRQQWLGLKRLGAVFASGTRPAP